MESLWGDNGGQSSVLGIVILLALAMILATAVVALGGSALSDTRQQSELSQAEHTMTQFDSLTAQVALGDSTVQRLQMGQSEGNYRVDPSAGHVEVVHANYSGNGDSEVIYGADLGAVIYENGDQTIAYQGGGIWRTGRTDAGRIVSPPEFHYRGATLTFPVVRVNQGGAAAGTSGSPRATIEQVGSSTEIFPDSETNYTGAPSQKYLNPAGNGTVYVDIRSEFYRGWADYFRSRTAGNVTIFPGNQTARVRLVSTGNTGEFPMPAESGSIEVRGVSDHSLTDFSIELVDDQDDSAKMNNLKWSLWAEDGDRQYEMHLRHSSGSSCSDPITVSAVVYYSPADGDSDSDDPYHGWKNSTAYRTTCRDVDGDGEDETVLTVDFVDDESGDGTVSDSEGDEMFNYTTLDSKDVLHFDNPGNDLLGNTSSPIEFAGHDVGWEPRSYDPAADDTTNPSRESIDRIVNHYFSELGPGFDLTVDDKDSNTVAERLSSGTIDYTPGGEFVTYMSITENNVRVEFE